MAGYSGSSDYTKTALVVLLLTSVVHLVSFGAPYWTTRHNGNAGLWTGCADGECYERWNLWVARECQPQNVLFPQGSCLTTLDSLSRVSHSSFGTEAESLGLRCTSCQWRQTLPPVVLSQGQRKMLLCRKCPIFGKHSCFHAELEI